MPCPIRFGPDPRMTTRAHPHPAGPRPPAPGRVEIVRPGLHLAGAGVDAPECLAEPPARAGDALHPTHSERSADRVVSPPGALRARSRRRPAPLAHARSQPGTKGERRKECHPVSTTEWASLPRAPRSERLEEGLGKSPADAHRLAHRLHLRPERAIRARELRRRSGKLDDHVVGSARSSRESSS